MPQLSYPYASTRAKAKENTLIGREKMLRLINAATPEEAIKLLADYGYPQAEELAPEEFETSISAVLHEAMCFVREVTPEKAATDLYFCRFDYHNLKVLLKELYFGGKNEDLLVDTGMIPPAKLEEIVSEKRYQALPREMRQAVEELDRRFSVRPDGSLIDALLDRAYSMQLSREMKTVKDVFVRQLFAADIDFVNVRTVVRQKQAGMTRDIFERSILAGGLIGPTVLRRAFEATEDDMFQILETGRYQRELAAAFEYYQNTHSLAKLEKARQDYSARLAGQYKHDIFCIAPLLAYFFAKLRETQAVRMVMIGKLSGIEGRNISEILPEL